MNNRFALSLVFACVLQLVLCSAGCFKFTYDVSKKATQWGGFAPNKEYELLMDVFLIKPDSHIRLDKDSGRIHKRRSKRLALTPPHSLRQIGGLYRAPESIEEYEKDPTGSVRKDYKHFVSIVDVIGIVRKGTRIRCKRLDRHVGGGFLTGYGFWHTMYAEILTGPYHGKVVDIEDLGTFTKSKGKRTYDKKPDPRILRIVNDSEVDEM